MFHHALNSLSLSLQAIVSSEKEKKKKCLQSHVEPIIGERPKKIKPSNSSNSSSSGADDLYNKHITHTGQETETGIPTMNR
jgi:hypothetical protein